MAPKPNQKPKKMNGPIKAIPTRYNGFNYRSRTEARWAVFMTRAAIPFIHEPEGYDLGEDGFYLPDFYLPESDQFLEIKPDVTLPGRQSPVEALAAVTGKYVVTFCGSPTPNWVDYAIFDSRARGNGFLATPEGGWDDGYVFCECPHCHMVGLEFHGRADRLLCQCPKSSHGDKGYNWDTPRLERAYAYAASFSFWTPPEP